MNTESIARAAAAKLDADRNERIAAVQTLAKAAGRVKDARAELAAAEQAQLQSYRDAVKLGWTITDIKGFGIEVPSKNLGGRPRKAKTVTTKPVSDSTNQSTANGDQ